VQIVQQNQIIQFILKLEHATGLVTMALCEMETHAYRVKPMHGTIVDGARVVQAVEEVHNTVLWNAEINSEQLSVIISVVVLCHLPVNHVIHRYVRPIHGVLAAGGHVQIINKPEVSFAKIAQGKLYRMGTVRPQNQLLFRVVRVQPIHGRLIPGAPVVQAVVGVHKLV